MTPMGARRTRLLGSDTPCVIRLLVEFRISQTKNGASVTRRRSLTPVGSEFDTTQGANRRRKPQYA